MAKNMNIEDLITQILHMGFQLEDCQEAILAGKLSVEAAVDWLLTEKASCSTPTLRLKALGSSQFDAGGIIDQLPTSQNGIEVNSDSQDNFSVIEYEKKCGSDFPLLPDVKRNKKEEFEIRARKEFEESSRRAKLEKKEARIRILKQIAEDKEQRKQMQAEALSSQSSSSSNSFINLTELPKNNTKSVEGCTLQIRCPDGRLLKHTFSSTDTFEQLWKYLSNETVPCRNMTLMQPFPKREFNDNEKKTFEQLNLTPSSSLVLKPKSIETQETNTTGALSLVPSRNSPVMSSSPVLAQGNVQRLDTSFLPTNDLPLAIPAALNNNLLGPIINLMDLNILAEGLPVHLWGGGQRLGGEENALERETNMLEQRNSLPGSAAENRVCNIAIPLNEKCNTLMLSPTVLPLQDVCIKFVVKQILESTTIMSLNLPSQIAERILQQMVKDKILRSRYMQNFLSCRLIHLILDCYPYTTNELLHSIRYHTSLQHVSLVSCTLINDTGLQALITLKQLLSLNLRGCVQITDNCFTVLAEFRNLKSLSLEETKITDNGLLKYTSTIHEALQILNLNRTSITENSLILLKNLPNLKFLSLDNTKLTSLLPLPCLLTLKGLSIQATNIPTDDLSCLGNFPELTWLNITDMANVSGDDGLRVISELDLCHLNFPSRLSTTDDGLISVSKMSLLSLDLTNYINITDVGILSLRSMRSLKKLLLSNTKLTDSGLLALRDLNELEVLYLDRTAITDEGTVAFSGMPKLQELSLASTRIKGAFLTNGTLNRCVLLTKLNLSRTRIKIKALRGVCLPNLCLLNVDGTRLACDPSPLLIGCTKLKHVSAKNLQPPPALEVDSDSD